MRISRKTRDIRELRERHTVFLFHKLTRRIGIKEPALPCMCKPHFFTWPVGHGTYRRVQFLH